MDVLVLGGTAEAREVAAELVAAGVDVTSSLAGRVARPRLPPGDVRIGGFGGPSGLARWLEEQEPRVVIDATHPFAERMSTSAMVACAAAGVPLLRLARPAWEEQAGDNWHRVDDLAAAADAVVALGARRVLLALGSSGPQAFAALAEPWFLIRAIDPPAAPLPARHEVRLARGPFTLAGESALLADDDIDLVVCRDSGGAQTSAKLDAARAAAVPVVLVRRPAPPGPGTVARVDEALAWVLARLGPERR